jgi:hypothetical protein
MLPSLEDKGCTRRSPSRKPGKRSQVEVLWNPQSEGEVEGEGIGVKSRAYLCRGSW